jgi:hypothetical protein
MIAKEDQFIIQYLAGDGALKSDKNSLEFCYISNPDGTIRWMFLESLRIPMFLNFYSTSSIRAKILSFLIKSAYFFRFSNLVKSGDLQIHIQNGSVLDKILKKYQYDGFSIFTGTVGENRKAIIELHKNKQTFVFVKIALTESSKVLVANELKALNLLKSFKFDKLIIPELLDRSEDIIVELGDIKPKKYNQNTELNNLHIDSLNELYSKTYKTLCWEELSVLQSAKDKIQCFADKKEIANELINEQIKILCNKIILLIELIEKAEKLVSVSISHGDFTPWNMYVTKEKIHLFDWELSENKMPMMYDLIHFVFQSNILINKKGYQEIQRAINLFLRKSNSQLLLEKFSINFNLNYTFYLVYTVSYYLNKYVNQENLHDQVFWMINVWDEAVSDLLNNKGIVFYEE